MAAEGSPFDLPANKKKEIEGYIQAAYLKGMNDLCCRYLALVRGDETISSFVEGCLPKLEDGTFDCMDIYRVMKNIFDADESSDFSELAHFRNLLEKFNRFELRKFSAFVRGLKENIPKNFSDKREAQYARIIMKAAFINTSAGSFGEEKPYDINNISDDPDKVRQCGEGLLGFGPAIEAWKVLMAMDFIWTMLWHATLPILVEMEKMGKMDDARVRHEVLTRITAARKDTFARIIIAQIICFFLDGQNNAANAMFSGEVQCLDVSEGATVHEGAIRGAARYFGVLSSLDYLEDTPQFFALMREIISSSQKITEEDYKVEIRQPPFFNKIKAEIVPTKISKKDTKGAILQDCSVCTLSGVGTSCMHGHASVCHECFKNLGDTPVCPICRAPTKMEAIMHHCPCGCANHLRRHYERNDVVGYICRGCVTHVSCHPCRSERCHKCGGADIVPIVFP